jgi:nucleoside-diphosphate-sugar epimerase
VPFELVNVGSGKMVSVRQLVQKIIRHSGKQLGIAFDTTKPTIPFQLRLDVDRVKERYGWAPKVSLEEGIARTLQWCRENILKKQRPAKSLS